MIGTFVVKFNAMLREQAAVKVTLQVQTANKQMVRWRNSQIQEQMADKTG